MLTWALIVLVLYLIASSVFSIYPHRSFTELRNILSYLAFFLLVIAYTQTINQVRIFIWVLAFLGAVLTLFGFVLLFGSSTTIFRHIPIHNLNHLGSTFPNYNHFATYLGIIIPGTLALWWIERSPRRPLLLLLIGILISGLFFTLSRGGIGSFITGMILFVLLLPKTGVHKRRWIAVLTILLMSVAVMLITTHQPLSLRWIQSGEIFPSSRIALWKAAFAAFQSQPFFGFGLGTFRIFLPSFSQVSNIGHRHALNDYLEWLSELGIIGVALALLLLIAFLYALVQVAKKHQNSDLYLIVVGSVTSMFIVMMNAIVNFPFHIPAISCTLAFFTALPIALARTEDSGKYVKIAETPIIRWSLHGVALLIGVLLALQILRPWISEGLQDKAQSAWSSGNSEIALKLAHRALVCDPTDATIHDILGGYYRSLADKQNDHQLRNSAIDYFKRATEISPYSASYHYHLSEALIDSGAYDQARYSLRQAIHLNTYDIRFPLKLIEILVLTGDTTSAITEYHKLLSDGERHNGQVISHALRSLDKTSLIMSIFESNDVKNPLFLAGVLMESDRWEESKSIYEKLISWSDDPQLWQQYLFALRLNRENQLWFNRMAEYVRIHPDDSYAQANLIRALERSDVEFPLNENYVKLAIPDTASPQFKIAIGRRLLKQKDFDAAGEVFFNVLETHPDNLEALMGLGQSYEYSGHYLEAILRYRKFLRLQPENFDAHFRLALAYKKQGMLSQAVDQLKTCLQKNPQHQKARDLLNEIYRTLGVSEDSSSRSP